MLNQRPQSNEASIREDFLGSLSRQRTCFHDQMHHPVEKITNYNIDMKMLRCCKLYLILKLSTVIIVEYLY